MNSWCDSPLPVHVKVRQLKERVFSRRLLRDWVE